MSYPNKDRIAQERADFFKNGGEQRVRDQILGLPSIGKHQVSGEPWPAFHRCCICGEHPEPMGERCIKVGRFHEQSICEFCVDLMHKVLHEVRK